MWSSIPSEFHIAKIGEENKVVEVVFLEDQGRTRDARLFIDCRHQRVLPLVNRVRFRDVTA